MLVFYVCPDDGLEGKYQIGVFLKEIVTHFYGLLDVVTHFFAEATMDAKYPLKNGKKLFALTCRLLLDFLVAVHKQPLEDWLNSSKEFMQGLNVI